eukprot:350416-Chlamydomonas_euryale.AAC.1
MRGVRAYRMEVRKCGVCGHTEWSLGGVSRIPSNEWCGIAGKFLKVLIVAITFLVCVAVAAAIALLVSVCSITHTG